VVGQEQLQRFQEEMGKVLHDPFQVVMRQTRAPISLLQEKAKVKKCRIVFNFILILATKSAHFGH
jgi:nuclear GTP-binding protein